MEDAREPGEPYETRETAAEVVDRPRSISCGNAARAWRARMGSGLGQPEDGRELLEGLLCAAAARAGSQIDAHR